MADTGDEPARILAAGCDQLGLVLTPAQFAALCQYLEQLARWNRAYNLTAVRDPVAMVRRHILDSLAIAPLLTGRRFIDVGTGAGLPGIPLAIVHPEREFHLLDSNSKKTRFLFHVKTALGLDNMAVHHARVESYRPQAGFDAVLSRAFASLADMARDCAHLLVPGGRLLAMKGTYPVAELDALPAQCRLLSVTPVAVPGLAEQRHLVAIAL